VERHDVVVVGGGAIGLACAWRARQRGLDVVVLDRRDAGAATPVAAGMLSPATEAEFGEERLLELSLRAAELWPGFAAELDLPYRRCGALALAADADEAVELRRHHEHRASLGLPGEWLTPSSCRELEPGLAACAGGVLVPEEGECDPRALLAALIARVPVERASVVDGLWEGDRLAGVVAADGRRFEGAVVLASGCWGADWLPEPPPVRPVKGQVVRLRGPRVLERLIRAERVYLTPRASGELVVGATAEERGFDTTVTAGAVHELLREAYRILPEVAELELVEACAGLRPATPDNVPLVGLGPVEGLVYALGHYRNGILLAPATAADVAALLAGVLV
jgi:glycine oxidase